jgi:hypothetical protein
MTVFIPAKALSLLPDEQVEFNKMEIYCEKL